MVGKTSVEASKVVKKGARLSHKVEKATNGEDATGMKFIEGEVGRKAGKVAGKVGKKVGKTTAKYTYKGGKKAIQFSYVTVKSSIKKGVQVAKASTTIVKRAMTVMQLQWHFLLLSLQVHQLVLKDVLLIMYFQMEQQKEMHRLYGHT